MTDAEKDTIKRYLTVNAVLDQCLLSGIAESNIASSEPLRIVSINNVPLENVVRGICTIGFIKSQVERKQHLEDQLKKLIES